MKKKSNLKKPQKKNSTKIENELAPAPVAHPMSSDPANNEVVVKGLPFVATEDDVSEWFGAIGEVTNVKILYGPDGRSKGFGFVTFAQNETIAKAVEQSGADFKGRRIFIEQSNKSKGERDPKQGRDMNERNHAPREFNLGGNNQDGEDRPKRGHSNEEKNSFCWKSKFPN